MIKQFGHTWWGKQWLNALSNIDFSNRLPRGKTYARSGRARNIIIMGNTVNAQVQGSRPKPYKVAIALETLSSLDKQQIIAAITGNPVFLSQLLAREIPPSLHKELQQKYIELFPLSWEDMQASCSCPDWAMPCKHIAAVIYLIANEIDKNPFLIFHLHDLDVMEELEKLGFGTSKSTSEEIPSIPDILETLSQEPDSTPDTNEQKILDFSTLPECRDELLSLLTAKPLFYPSGDFKHSLEKELKQKGKDAKKLLETAIPEEEDTKQEIYPASVSHIHLTLDDELDAKEVYFQTSEGEHTYTSHKGNPVSKLCGWLSSLDPEKIYQYPPVVKALSLAQRLSLVLIRQGGVVPQIYHLGHNDYAIRWLPARLNESVNHLIEVLATYLLPDLLQVQADAKNTLYFSTQDQAQHLSSLFLNNFIQQSSLSTEVRQYISRYDRRDFSEDPIKASFFEGELVDNKGFEEKEIPVTIYLWLKRFYLTENPVVPVIKVEEAEGGFLIDLWVENKNDQQGPIALKTLFDKKEMQETRMAFLKDVAVLLSYFPQLSEVVTSRGKQPLKVGGETFAEIFLQILPVIRLLNIRVLLPKSLQKLVRPQLSMLLDAEDDGIEKHYLSLENLLHYKWQVSLGDDLLSPEEFMKIVEGMSGIVKIRDQYVFLDPAEVRKLLDKLENPPELKGQDLLQVALTESYGGTSIHLSKKAQQVLRSLLDSEEVPLPQGLQAQLRPYQLRGFAWMYKNSRIGFGSVIADDMGLGKTLQVITTLLKLKEEGYLKKKKALVVVPTTLLTNWQKEISRFAPQLIAHIYHGSTRKIPEATFDVLLTTYGIARGDEKKLSKLKWHTLVIDEAQNIKNPGTAQTKAIKKIKSDVRIAMSGTPVENRLSEYWSIMDFTNKGYLNTQKSFQREFAYPIEVEQDQKQLDRFRKATAPFIMRRLKTDKTIISDLPEKVSTDEYCALSKEQAALYQSVVNEIMRQVEGKDGIERQGLVFKLIMALKQVCNHPSHYLKKEDTNPELSGKSGRLMELLTQIYDNNEKVLIFTQFREMGELLQNIIKTHYHTEALFLHGGCSRHQRDEMVERFQHDPAIKTMILSLKAGGTGLNLTAASRVIHYDLWWNPAVEAQATDRAYRIGQKNKVFVHRLLTQGTFEEKINKMLQEKRELADMAVATGEKWIGEFSDNDLKTMFTLS